MDDIIDKIYEQVINEACANPLRRFAELVAADALAQSEKFKPDWDMIEPYHERIKQLEIQNKKLRQALAQSEQEPVAWVRDLTSPSTHCVTSLKYLSIADADAGVKYIPVYTAPSKPWVSLSDRDITGAAHGEARYPVSILEITDSGLCMQFSETGEWHASDKRGDYMKVNGFLMSFARAVEAELRSKNT